MSHQHCHISTAEMADSMSVDSMSTEAGCGGHLLHMSVKLARAGPKRQLTHAWPGVATTLEISLPTLRH